MYIPVHRAVHGSDSSGVDKDERIIDPEQDFLFRGVDQIVVWFAGCGESSDERLKARVDIDVGEGDNVAVISEELRGEMTAGMSNGARDVGDTIPWSPRGLVVTPSGR